MARIRIASFKAYTRADGTLKDASEIEWFNDPTDDVTMSQPLGNAPSSSSQAQGTLESFIRPRGAGVSPATPVAGTRRSARVTKPSANVREAPFVYINEWCVRVIAKHQ
ncbi:hypothetical protein HWV62_32323 [Athelia sp. TMB]|nr:hypothetical protein HWV62_32323 [Athelia sp. TMB]